MAKDRGEPGSRGSADRSQTRLHRGEDGPIDVLIVDDHELFRTGLADLLTEEGLNVVGAVADGESALELVVQAAPDVVLMDLDMPGISGIEATRRIAAIAPCTRVVILTVDAEEQSLVDAVGAGACGYLLKGTSLEALVAGIRAAVAGESLISGAVGAKLFERLRAEHHHTATERRVFEQLSKREIEILKLLAVGKHNVEIAQELVLSPHTVRNHISNILAKLQISNRVEATAYAVRNRMV